MCQVAQGQVGCVPSWHCVSVAALLTAVSPDSRGQAPRAHPTALFQTPDQSAEELSAELQLPAHSAAWPRRCLNKGWPGAYGFQPDSSSSFRLRVKIPEASSSIQEHANTALRGWFPWKLISSIFNHFSGCYCQQVTGSGSVPRQALVPWGGWDVSSHARQGVSNLTVITAPIILILKQRKPQIS